MDKIPQITLDYWELVMVDMRNFNFATRMLYDMDNRRTKMHEKLAEYYGLDHEETKSITDNMESFDKYGQGPRILHRLLIDMKNGRR